MLRKNIWQYCVILCICMLLSACMYPDERRMHNQPPLPVHIEQVQLAIDRFQESRGVLPIHTKPADTPLFEKYIIDFQQLTPAFVERPPASAFEMGGTFQYVLVEVEDNPTVKLLDLRMSETVREVQLRVNQYVSRYDWLPVKESIELGYFTLDYDKLNMKIEPTVISPFSRQNLPLIVSANGRVGIDYRFDLYQAIEQLKEEQEQMSDELEQELGLELKLADEDIRYLLYQDSYFAPGHSFPYIFDNESGSVLLK